MFSQVHSLLRHSVARTLAFIALSGVLCGLYARGEMAWMLGFGMLVPWLRVLDAQTTLAGNLRNAWLMAIAFTAAAFAWFGMAIGDYTGIGAITGLSVLLLAAPLFQPQFLAFALVRWLVGRRYGPVLRALAAACAWIATEWLLPKVLGDSLGYGLHPSTLLRQGADLGGTAGLTLLLLLANEALAFALSRRAQGWRSMVHPMVLATMIPALMAVYGGLTLATLPAPQGPALRIGLIQSNLVNYEERRREAGAHAVVREILDTHFAMAYDAVERRKAQAVLWSETAYPTTFGHPKSEAGAEFDNEIRTIVNAAGVPFVFGTYDSDDAGEYNAAAVVAPGTGLVGFYRKTRLFPLTEYVPQWLDGPALRQWLPWTGGWRAGSGARVLPLKLADGREIPVAPSICLDDVDTTLALDGARLGAQAILTMSNDSWFTRYPLGAQMHQTAAAFRSIETRLPQFRVTSNGFSAAIDATGTIVAGSRMGEQTLVMAELQVPVPPRTLLVAWGDWVGAVSSVFLLWLALWTASQRWRMTQQQTAAALTSTLQLPVRVAVLPAPARWVTAALRGFARLSLLGLGMALMLDDSLRGNTLAQIRLFAGLFLAPEAAAWCMLLAYSARLSLQDGMLVLERGTQRMELARRDIAAVELWRLGLPGPGVLLRLHSGGRWPYGLVVGQPLALARALLPDAASNVQDNPSRALRYAQVRCTAPSSRFERSWLKFLAFPLLLATAAFHLHQNIAYGGLLGEYYSYGLKAYLVTFALWWAAWAIGVTLCAAALRAAIEMGTMLTLAVRPAQTAVLRLVLERSGLALLYLGLPLWLLQSIR